MAKTPKRNRNQTMWPTIPSPSKSVPCTVNLLTRSNGRYVEYPTAQKGDSPTKSGQIADKEKIFWSNIAGGSFNQSSTATWSCNAGTRNGALQLARRACVRTNERANARAARASAKWGPHRWIRYVIYATGFPIKNKKEIKKERSSPN